MLFAHVHQGLTAVQNNLAELWALLNFVLPDLFADLDTFQEWLNMPETAAQRVFAK